jgi:hypothetical protein
MCCLNVNSFVVSANLTRRCALRHLSLLGFGYICKGCPGCKSALFLRLFSQKGFLGRLLLIATLQYHATVNRPSLSLPHFAIRVSDSKLNDRHSIASPLLQQNYRLYLLKGTAHTKQWKRKFPLPGSELTAAGAVAIIRPPVPLGRDQVSSIYQSKVGTSSDHLDRLTAHKKKNPMYLGNGHKSPSGG